MVSLQEPVRHPWSLALRSRFAFETPVAFQSLEERGLFRWSEEFRHADLSRSGDSYLWFNDMEWYQPEDLRSFEFESHHKSGFVPFAHAANGDYWCWYPAMEDGGDIPVLLCPHDCYDADLYAPNFAAALYRHALEYAADIDEVASKQYAMLTRFAVELGSHWPIEWREQIERVTRNPLQWSEYATLIAEEFGSRYTGHFQVRWMDEA